MNNSLNTQPGFVNEMDFYLGVSMLNRTGVSEYGLQFFRLNWQGEVIERINTRKTEGFKIHHVWEDSEIGEVVIEDRLKFYSLRFGHDGDEPFTCDLKEVNGPKDEWTIDDWINHASKGSTNTDSWKQQWRSYFVNEEVFAKWALDMMRFEGKNIFLKYPKEDAVNSASVQS